jgi:hypothetical protein
MKCFTTLRFPFFAVILLSLFASSCKRDTPSQSISPPADSYDYRVFKTWTDKFLELDRYAKGNRPGTGPRALAYLGLSAYESVVAGIPENNSLAVIHYGLDMPKADPSLEYYWPACVNESYAFLMKKFFFQMETEYASLYQGIDLLRDLQHDQFATQTTPEVLARSEAFGKAVAEAIYQWEQQDVAGHNAFLTPQPTDYLPPSGPGLWLPTWPDYGTAVFPFWGDVRRFAMRETDLLAKPPIQFNESTVSLFYGQAFETYQTVNNILANEPGAFEGRWKAEFWSDDILGLTFGPPPRLAAIANQAVEKENLNLAQCAELYVKLGMALSDAGVSVWKSKYYYNLERPITYIRRVVAQHDPNAANWQTLLNDPISGTQGITPAFPAYPSGHSGFAGAGGKILSSFFEYNPEHPGAYTFTDLCHQGRTEFLGTPRTFTSFTEMANEDAFSRIPLGVHYRMDCEEGLRLGELAAHRVLELPWKK